MTLKEYIKGLQGFMIDNPGSENLKVITSRDDEGNGYNQVHYGPSKGEYYGNEFIDYAQFEDYGRDESSVNSVCVN